MSSLKEIKTKDAWEEFSSNIPSSTLQIIYFKAEWATPMTTVLETLSKSYPVTDPPSTLWICMDAEDVIEVSDLFNVTAVPYLVLRRGDQVVESISGCDASKVRTAIEKIINSPPPAQSALPDKSSSHKVEIKDTPATVKNVQQPDVAIDNPTENDEKKEDLHTRLAKLVKAAPVMLFMKGTPATPQCGFSRQIVALLRESGIKYGFFNILADDEVRQGLKEFADWPTYPQLWINGELVGGLDIVKEELASNPDFLKSCSTVSAPTEKTE